MNRRTSLISMLVFTLVSVVCFFGLWPSGASAQTQAMKWYKGNLHTHTVNSDGDSTPNEVVSWYRDNRYHFLVISDHDYITGVDGLNAVHGARERFLLIPGEEVTSGFDGKPIHLNAYSPSRVVQPAGGTSVAATIQANVDAIRAAGGLAALNHPNFGWAVTSKELSGIRDLSLFEVYNGHPGVNNRGGGGVESLDELWDAVLTSGKRIFGIATDDAHHFKSFGRTFSNPGRGWVMVRAPELTPDNIIRALASGNFYASTGVELADIRVSDSEYRIEIKPARGTRQTTFFIGQNGQILAKGFENTATYSFRGGERYVRARVEASNGDTAWTQPVFLSR